MATTTEPKALSVKQTARCSGLGERTVWRLIETGALRSVRVGRRVLISVAELDRFLAGEGVDSTGRAPAEKARRQSPPSRGGRAPGLGGGS